MQCRYYTARKKSPEFSLIELVFADFRFTEPHEKFLKTMDDAGYTTKKEGPRVGDYYNGARRHFFGRLY